MSRYPHYVPPPIPATPDTLAGVVEHARQAAIIVGQPWRVTFSASSLVAGVWTWSGQVRNQAGQACRGGFLVRVFVATTRGGVPGGSQTVAWQTGQVVSTYTPHQHWEVLTEADGSFSLQVTAASERFVAALVLGVADYSEGAG